MATKKLITCIDEIEANMFKNMLENEDIECFLTNENFTTLFPGLLGSKGTGIQVMINESDYDKAMEIISENNDIEN
ncbi:MAG: hypothetical protein QG635_864 [Bacteroidota bacterium]|nr:hypothetical protein [Bacteroidota bacterium]